jgi:outer membrane protein TolC
MAAAIARGQLSEPSLHTPPPTEFSLDAYMQRVVEYNDSVQARLLGFHAARSQRKAEGGAFEPVWATTGQYVDNHQANTVEQERNLRTGGLFRERNQLYSSGIEVLSPIGTRVRVGVTGNELINNIQRTVASSLDSEYQTAAGVTIEQPLLKGFGRSATLAALRIAARNSDVAYQEYRHQLMQVTAEAEVAYWELYFAQQEVALTAESVKVAETLGRDSKASFDAGRGSNLDVLEAEAGLALRKSRARLSEQKRVEAANRVAAFLGQGALGVPGYVATEAPPVRPVEVLRENGHEVAVAMNAELLRAEALAGQERVRLGFAKNQRLPDMNFKVAYQATGLDSHWRNSWGEVERESLPQWTVGLELRIPLFGGIRGKNEQRAALLRLQQAERNIGDLHAQLNSALNSAEERVSSTYAAAQSLAVIVDFRSNLLKTRLQAREIGRVDSRSVLEAEQDLTSAKLDRLQSAIEYEKALLDLQLASGTLLQARGLEIRRDALEEQTAKWSNAPTARVATLQYHRATFDRWPAFAPMPFDADNNPGYPLRLSLTRSAKRK